MEQKSFQVKVSDINLHEYLSALRWLTLTKELALVGVMVVIFVFLLVNGTNSQPHLLLVPPVAIVAIVAYFEITHLLDYRKFPKDLEMTFEMDAHGWRLRVMDHTGICAWANTVKLVDNKLLFLLYNSKKTSNLLPKRCLTPEQIQQIREWYKHRFDLTETDLEDDEEEEPEEEPEEEELEQRD